MRSLATALSLLACGCTLHAGIGTGAGTSSGSTGAAATVHVHTGPALGALIGLGFVAGIVRSEAPYAPDRLAVAMDPHRRVVVQDCTRPLEDPEANLRCR